MCGRFSLASTPAELDAELGIAVPADYAPRYNIAPTQDVLAIVAAKDGAPELVRLRWGLVPFWAKDPSVGNRMINARSETVLEKPAFRTSLERRRCLVLADGFYEWQKQGKYKLPMRVCRASRRPLTFAGLWEVWGPRGGPRLRSCTILTSDANALVQPIHDRMPVILTADARARWLERATSAEELRALLRPYAGDDLEAYAVSDLVNNPGNDLPECFDPVAEPPAEREPQLTIDLFDVGTVAADG